MKHFLIALFAVCLLGISCTKEHRGSVHVHGFASDQFTRVPIEGADLMIYEELNYGAAGTSYGGGGEGLTYSGGEFSFYPEGLKKDNVVTKRELVITKDSVIRLGTGRAPMGKLQEEMEVTVSVITDCRVNYRFINNAPFDVNDSLYGIYVERPWGQQTVGNGINILVGPSINQELLSGYYGYSETVLHYSVRKNGILTQRTDTLTVADPFTCQILNRTINY